MATKTVSSKPKKSVKARKASPSKVKTARAKPARAKLVKRKPARRSSISAAAKRRQRAKRPPSSLELKIYKMLDDLGVEYLKEHKVSRCTVDIFIAPTTVVEINGCFWHRHTCQKTTPATRVKDASVRRADDRRYHILRKLGYSVALIWECEVKDNPAKVISLLEALGNQ